MTLTDPIQRPDVSIVIPTHDRAALLSRTLSSLALVEIPAGTALEVVVVVSACSDDSLTAVRTAQRTSPHRIQIVEEPKPGLSLARNRGLRAAHADLVAFLDDDVWVEKEWLRALTDASSSTPAGLFAGRVLLEWESRPPLWTSPAVERLLSVNDLGHEMREFFKASSLVGANFAIRRSVVESVGEFSATLGRRGRDLLSGEESDLVARAIDAGHRLFYIPGMAGRHWIPSQRASFSHLKALAFARGRTRVRRQRAGLEKSACASAYEGVARALTGAVREVDGWVRRDEAKRIAARLLCHRGLGMLYGLLHAEGRTWPARRKGRR